MEYQKGSELIQAQHLKVGSLKNCAKRFIETYKLSSERPLREREVERMTRTLNDRLRTQKTVVFDKRNNG